LWQHFRLQLSALSETIMEDEEKLSRTLQLARDEIKRLNPTRAFEYLGAIEFDVCERRGTAIWAEHKLLFASALAETGNSAAKQEFDEALERIRNLPDRDLDLEMRIFEDYAKYLACFEHRRSKAREYLQAAREIALKQGLLEDSARLQLKIIKIDLEIDEDPRKECFQNLKKAAKELGASFQKQLAAWVHYCTEDKNSSLGMIAARKKGIASVGYFRGVLTLVK